MADEYTEPSEKSPLNEGGSEIKVYRRRWYIVFLVSLSMMLNTGVFATWGPIAQSAKAVYGWTDGTITILVNAGNGAAMVSVIVAIYLIEKKGLRTSMLVCVLLQAIATGVRIITTKTPYATWLIGAGQFCNGLSGSILTAIPPVMSETWFPSNERTTATAFAYLSTASGAAVEFIVGPSIVQQPPQNWSTMSNITEEIDTIRNQIYTLNLIEFGVGAVLLLLTVVYFPAHPPSPPSRSAIVSRRDFKEGMLEIIRHPSAWWINIVFALPIGVFGNWLGLIDVIVDHVGLSQSDAGWLGFYASLSGFVAGIVVGRVTDRFGRHTKLLVIAAYTITTLMFTWFTLMCAGVLPRSKVTLIVSAVVGSMMINAVGPALYELCCETAYPVGEGVTGGLFTIILNVVGFVFLLLTSIKQIGTSWMNWCLIGTMTLATIMMACFKERYPRMDIDTGVTDSATPKLPADNNVYTNDIDNQINQINK